MISLYTHFSTQLKLSQFQRVKIYRSTFLSPTKFVGRRNLSTSERHTFNVTKVQIKAVDFSIFLYYIFSSDNLPVPCKLLQVKYVVSILNLVTVITCFFQYALNSSIHDLRIVIMMSQNRKQQLVI